MMQELASGSKFKSKELEADAGGPGNPGATVYPGGPNKYGKHAVAQMSAARGKKHHITAAQAGDALAARRR